MRRDDYILVVSIDDSLHELRRPLSHWRFRTNNLAELKNMTELVDRSTTHLYVEDSFGFCPRFIREWDLPRTGRYHAEFFMHGHPYDVYFLEQKD